MINYRRKKSISGKYGQRPFVSVVFLFYLPDLSGVGIERVGYATLSNCAIGRLFGRRRNHLPLKVRDMMKRFNNKILLYFDPNKKQLREDQCR
jgi:hypothetical protein